MARDPKTYREMSIPHESTEAATKALKEFFKGISALRKEHRIQNVMLVMQTTAINKQGEEGEYLVAYHLGDQLRYESLAAYAYAHAKRDRNDLIAAILRGDTATIPIDPDDEQTLLDL